jgi:hypothetical protein
MFMAKKKSKNNNVAKYTTFISVLLGIVAVVMMFLPAISITDSEASYTGLQLAFGYSETPIKIGSYSATIVYFNFSFMNLLTYILVILGVVFTVLGSKGKGGAFASFISALMFIVGGVFFFMQGSFSVPGEILSIVKDSFVLAIGAIIGGVASILAGICALAKIVLNK